MEPTTNSEKWALEHAMVLQHNAWLEDTATMEQIYYALSSGVLDEMVLMDEELMIRNTHKHWHDPSA